MLKEEGKTTDNRETMKKWKTEKLFTSVDDFDPHSLIPSYRSSFLLPLRPE